MYLCRGGSRTQNGRSKPQLRKGFKKKSKLTKSRHESPAASSRGENASHHQQTIKPRRKVIGLRKPDGEETKNSTATSESASLQSAKKHKVQVHVLVAVFTYCVSRPS